jgi:hypothetical protein
MEVSMGKASVATPWLVNVYHFRLTADRGFEGILCYWGWSYEL